MLQNHPPLVSRNSSGAFYPYTVDNSLRFDGGSSPLSRTPDSGNNTTFSFSAWIKPGNNHGGSGTASPFQAQSGSVDTALRINDSSHASYPSAIWPYAYNGSYVGEDRTVAVYRDHSAWYHILWVVDTTNGTEADRSIVYVNGVRQTLTQMNAWTSSGNTGITTVTNYVMRTFDGYASEIIMLDGTAASPSSFGETKEGVWVPKDPSGLTFGTNGFYLDFKDGTSATTLGYDVSGNANHFTASGIATTDQMTDTPTNNFCTFNPLAKTASTATYSNGNLKVVTGNVGGGNGYGTIAIPESGKWYFEMTLTAMTDSALVGIGNYLATEDYAGSLSDSVFYYFNGYRYVDGSTSTYGSSYTAGDVIGVAVDADAGDIEFFKNNASQGSITHNVAGLFPIVADFSSGSGATFDMDFGQLGFTYTPPTDFLALCTANLPEPTLGPNSTENVTDYFDVVLYEGTGAELAISSLSFSPDLVVIKNRDAADQWMVFDTVRGATKYLSWDGLDLEVTDAQSLKTFDSLGFTLGTNVAVNTSAESYVAYCFKEHADFFDVVGWTGDGAASKNLSHSLTIAPEFFYAKNRVDASFWWYTYVESLPVTDPQTDYLGINSSNAVADDAGMWNDTAPTASVFTVGTIDGVNKLSDTYISHLWASMEGMCKVGYYKGNGSADGPFAYCGFRPAFLMIKRTDVANNWIIVDTARSTYNGSNPLLYADLPNSEDAYTAPDILSNGFKGRDTATGLNTSGGNYVFLAFAEMPFKYSNAR